MNRYQRLVSSRFRLLLLIGLMSLLCLLSSALAAQTLRTFRIGVLAHQGFEQCLLQWTPTIDYLNEELPDIKLALVPLDFDQIDAAVRDKSIDFLIANTSIYAEMDMKYNLSPIATLKNKHYGNSYSVFGGVIFTRRDKVEIQSLPDLKHKRFAAVAENSFGGWRMAYRELKKQGLKIPRDFSDLTFAGSHDAVVIAVQKGDADAGTVRTETLERMADKGLVSLDEFRILNPQEKSDQFPLLLSTSLYPEWPIARLTHTSDHLAQSVAGALIAMNDDDPAAIAAKLSGWTIPQSYQSVHECMRELRLGPYQNYGVFTIRDVYKRYRFLVFGLSILLLGLILLILWIYRLNHRLRNTTKSLKVSDLQLRNLNEQFQVINDNLNVGIALIDREMKVLMVNKQMHRWFAQVDYEKHISCFSAFQGTHFDSVCDECPVRKTFMDGISHRLERRIEDRNGIQYYSVSSIPVRNESGNIVSALEMVVNITEQKEAEETITEQNRLLAGVLDAVPDVICIQNIDHTIELYNQAGYKMLNKTYDEVVGKKCYELIGRKDECENCASSRAIISKQIEHAERYVPELDIYLECSSNPILDAKGNVIKIVEQIRDITAKKKQEILLRKSEERHRLLAENATDVIWTWDKNGVFNYVSPSVFKLRGFTPEEVLRENLEDSLTSDSYHLFAAKTKQIRDAMANSEPIPEIRLELEQPCKDGSTVWTEVTISGLYNDKKKYVGILGLTRDISDRKKAQDELLIAKEHAEAASKAKSDFLANMSHEIRTPLNGVIGFTELLKVTPLDETQLQYLDNANVSAHSLLSIINDILDFSKIEAGKLELDPIKTDLIELIEQASDIVKYQASKKGLELLLNINPEMPRFANVDPIRLKQILVNLVSNAVKFTHQGEVEMRVDFVCVNQSQGKFTFYVRDTGIGISDEEQERLFKAFSQADSSTTRKFGGTGLGLIISNLLAEKMGGKIELSSEPDKGSIFYFTIETEYEHGEKYLLAKLRRLKKVLVIDDNVHNRTILEHTLQHWNMEVTCCEGALEAVELLREDNPYDVMIVDYQMPYIDGIQTIKMLRSKLETLSQKLPSVILYGSADDTLSQEELKAVGIRFRLIKPVKARELFYYLASVNDDLPGFIYSENKSRKKVAEKQKATIPPKEKPVFLIAEDNVMNMILVRTILKRMVPDLEMLEAFNGKEVLEKVNTHRIDLILMDIQMPEMDGIEATRMIRAGEKDTGKHIPIIALTAGAIKGERERCLEVGMDDFLTKPIEQYKFSRVLAKFMDQDSDVGTAPETLREEMHSEHFDRSSLLKRIYDNESLLQDLIGVASSQISNYLQTLDLAIQQKNVKQIVMTAHTIRGTSLNMSLLQLADLAIRIEENAEVQSFDAKAAFKEIVQEWNLIQKIFKEG